MSGTSIVWEGQFKHDELHGFGRYIRITGEGVKTVIIGFFKNGLAHGYAKKEYQVEY